MIGSKPSLPIHPHNGRDYLAMHEGRKDAMPHVGGNRRQQIDHYNRSSCRCRKVMGGDRISFITTIRLRSVIAYRRL